MATPIPTNQAAFTLAEVLRVTAGRAHGGQPDLCLVSVSTDTRTITQGSIFVALRGERFDGHQFVAQAVSLGAGLALVEQELAIDVPQVVVPDTLRALGQLAAFHRQRWGGATIAIAGAAGKTTTRCVTSALLSEVAGSAVHSTVGNLNNQIGVPMILFGLGPAHRYAVIEVGTNQLGEVPLLADIVKPEVSVLTLIDLEHTEGLFSLDAIEREEGAIFARSCHTLVVNGDDVRALGQAKRAASEGGAGRAPPKVLTYGTKPDAELRLVQRETPGAHSSRLTLARGSVAPFTVTVPLVGAPASYAVMAALAASEALLGRQLTVAELQRGLGRSDLKPDGRAELVDGPNGVLIVDDSYNANPASMRSAIQTAVELVRLRGGALHLVLGEMRELGALSEQAHADLGRSLATIPWVSVFAIGEQMEPLIHAVQGLGTPGHTLCHTRTTEGVAQQLSQLLGPKDVVLVKGSRGVRTERVIADLVPENTNPK